MKVLERKEWEKEFAHVCICTQCESKLEVDSKDLVYEPGGCDMRGDRWMEKFSAVCAVCQCGISIPVEVIPKYVQKLARDRHSRNSRGAWDR